MNDQQPEFLTVGASGAQRRIAVRHQVAKPSQFPGVVWLGGFKSDMKGTKAQALADWAERAGRGFVRFDYSGHGESGGNFADGMIGKWLEESLAVFDHYCRGAQILVGSSMGGWIALLLARELRRRAANSPEHDPEKWEPVFGKDHAQANKLAGMVLIAPAVDFTEELMWKKFPSQIKQALERDGAWTRPSEYEPGGYLITKNLIEEGRNHLLLGGMIETGCPVRILQGARDPDVPWQHAVELVSKLARDDVVLTLVKDGDHRLSRPEDIAQLIRTIENL
jgi:pimeloyl-ACP methyl ester carboxylesterase